ncbi:hypothetical protein [Aeromonas phage T7-Ah]|uniref:Uncharacterized protein n=1 Tax=Aeromonas phage T7-Ah TaxID=2759196 RepID=A0A7S6HSB6_9CAUD|nr:hypothetical protein [Aeromonas phage T7-Ah]
MSYDVHYYKVSAGTEVVHKDDAERYAKAEGQDLERILDVISSMDRVEYYVCKKGTFEVVSMFALTVLEDMHHGKLAAFLADFTFEEYRNLGELAKTRMWYLKRFCETYGLTKYQRSHHLSESRQLVITKEV